MVETDNSGVLPLLIVLVVVGVGILFLGWILIAFTTKTLITVVLIGLGAYLLVRPKAISGLGAQARVFIPFALIILGIAFYAGVFSGWF